jgi:epoxyqueuosine reductase
MPTSPTDPALVEALRARAREIGFGLIGVTAPDPSGHMPFYRRWLAEGAHGEMAYLARDHSVRRRADLTGTMESVRSVIVVADEYAPPGAARADRGARARTADDEARSMVADTDSLAHPSRGVIARYARGADYHRVLKKKLLALLRWLDDQVEGGVEGRAYVDTGPILERELARRAGLGWFGRNTMLINPRRGSYFFLGVLLVDVELPRDAPHTADHCGSCRACLDACPTGALLGRDENGAPRIDARRCISYLTIELRGPIPRELRPAIGNRIFGCDICQEVCPFNMKFAAEATEPRYAPRGPGERPFGVEPEPGRRAPHPGTASATLVNLLAMALDEGAWDSYSRGSAIRRAGRAGFARNVAVALGNWGSPDAVPALTAALSDPVPLVRGHAAWALGRVGSSVSEDRIRDALKREDDPFVRSELEAALSSRGRNPAAVRGERSTDHSRRLVDPEIVP